MPNYTLVANNRFQNRSFDDLLRPLAMYTEEYNNLENQVADLDTKASVWEGIADEEQDPVAYAQYKRYADDLRSQATQLAHSGLNPSTRRSLLNLKKRYASEITPIEQAYTNRKQQAEEQRKAMLQNPTLLLSRRADLTSLDQYLNNPQLGYDMYSGSLLTQQVGSAAAALAKGLRDYGNGKKLDGFTKTWLQQHGYTPAEVAQAINHPDSPQSNKVLGTLVDNVMADSGIPRWADRSTLNQAYSYARQGLWNAVGQTQIQTYKDTAAEIAAKEASQRRLMNENSTANTTHPLLIPRALRSQQEIDTIVDKVNYFVQHGYVKKEGDKYVLTSKGRREYVANPTTSNRVVGTSNTGATQTGAAPVMYSFRQFMDELNGGKPLYDGKNKLNHGKGNFMPTHANNLFNNAFKRASSEVYDMYHSTEYVQQVPKADAEDLKNQIFSEPEVLQNLDFNGKDGFKGKSIKKEDLKDFVPTRRNYSIYGNTITWVNDKGETIRTNAPIAVNERVNNTTRQAMANASKIARIIQVGKVPLGETKDGIQFSTIPLTPEMVQAYKNDWQKEMDVVQTIGAMYVAPSTTKKQEYRAFEFGM